RLEHRHRPRRERARRPVQERRRRAGDGGRQGCCSCGGCPGGCCPRGGGPRGIRPTRGGWEGWDVRDRHHVSHLIYDRASSLGWDILGVNRAALASGACTSVTSATPVSGGPALGAALLGRKSLTRKLGP